MNDQDRAIIHAAANGDSFNATQLLRALARAVAPAHPKAEEPRPEHTRVATKAKPRQPPPP